MSDLLEPAADRFPNIAIRDVRFIGDQILILGDSIQVMRTLGKDVIDHIITDPPYEQSMQNRMNSRLKMKLNTPDFKQMRRSKLHFAGIDEIRKDFLDLAHITTKRWVLCFCTIEGVGNWEIEMDEAKVKYRGAYQWHKPDPMPSITAMRPAFACEQFVIGWAGTGHSRWNGGGKAAFYSFRVKNKDREGTHPTEKPLGLMMAQLKDFTDVGDVVLDPFMGSGTTLAACQKMGRLGIGIEISEEYFDICCVKIAGISREIDLFPPVPKVKPARFDFDALVE